MQKIILRIVSLAAFDNIIIYAPELVFAGRALKANFLQNLKYKSTDKCEELHITLIVQYNIEVCLRQQNTDVDSGQEGRTWSAWC